MDHRAEKLILVDCDGVLLDWKYAFYKYMNENGYTVIEEGQYDVAQTFGITKEQSRQLVRQFNESARIGFLPGLRTQLNMSRNSIVKVMFFIVLLVSVLITMPAN